MQQAKFLYRSFWAVLIASTLYGAKVAAQTTPSATSRVPAAAGTAVTVPSAYGAGTTVNYVRTWVPQQPINADATVIASTNVVQVSMQTQYADGLGRPIQAVGYQVSPGKKDMVSPVVYDAYEREQYKYLPYAATGTDGRFKTNPFADQATFYGSTYPAEQPAYTGETFYYGHTNYEPSPLDRAIETFAPGNSWAGSEGGSAERSVNIKYLVNTATTGDAVRIWTITSNALTYTSNDVTTNIPTSTATYAAGTLYKTVTIDEHGKATVQYKDVDGQVILKKVQIGTIATDYSGYDGFLCTYYVYDDLHQLRYVMQPRVIALLLLAGNWVLNTNMINELSFRYEYDSRQRMMAKKVPGAGWTYMVYDKRDRLVFTQDANMGQKNQWLGTLYDNLNRPVETGMLTYTGGTPATLQTWVTNNTGTYTITATSQNDLSVSSRVTGTPEYLAGNSITFQPGFSSESNAEFVAHIDAIAGITTVVSDNPIPTGSAFIPLTYTSYDDYAGNTTKTYNATNNTKLDYGQSTPYPNANTNTEPLPTATNTMVRGLPTVSKVRVIEDANNLTLGAWLETATFYDDEGRPVQVQSTNYEGGLDVVTSLYNFTNNVVCTYAVHNNPAAGISNLRIKTNMQYDHAGRLLTVYKNINDDAGSAASTTRRLVAQYVYDAMGNMKQKKIGQKTVSGSVPTSTPMEDDGYAYNIRGWMKGINWNYPGSATVTTTPNVSAGTNKWFGMDLSYDWGYNNNQYNGNIAGQRWMNAGDGAERSYGYGYDAANRLLKGDFRQNFAGTWSQSDPGNTNYIINYDMKMGDGVTASSAYDENGNISRMRHWGLVLNTSNLIDDLGYTYENGNASNKLRAVTDIGNQPSPALGDFVDKSTGADDYGYDKNGNMITDLNKSISGSTGVDLASGGAITYNHLNLPYKITVSGKGNITYIYDATGNKLEKRTVETAPPAGSPGSTTTTYVSAFVYQNNVLQYFGMEEGRIRPVAAAGINNNTLFAYDYILKDHLGNTRVVLTDELQQDVYPAATLEGDAADNSSAIAVEDNYYTINTANIASQPAGVTSYNKNGGTANATDPPVNNNPNSNTTAASQKMYKLNGTGGAKTGLGITLKVMAGDKIDIWGNSYYAQNNTAGTNNNIPVTDILSGLLGTPTAAMAGKGATTALLNTPGGTIIPSAFLSRTPVAGDQVPNAYINYIFFDEQFKYVSGGYSRVGSNGVLKTTHHNDLSGVAVPKNGYIYVYVSNQSPVDVFFDNLQVIHTRGPLLETDNYYPFGLVQSGISSQAGGKLDNKLKYNKGSELQNKEFSDGGGLETYTTQFRMLDPQLGRWWQIDPKPDEAVSPYVSMGNNPIVQNDPLGDIVTKTRDQDVSRKDFREMKRDIRRMRRNSATFNTMYKEFKRDKNNVYNYNATNSSSGSDAKKDGNLTKINIGMKTIDKVNNADIHSTHINDIAHETGHGWLIKNGYVPNFPTFPNVKIPGMSSIENSIMNQNQFITAEAKWNTQNESAAAHIDNIVVSELKQSGSDAFKSLGFEHYYNGFGTKSSLIPGSNIMQVNKVGKVIDVMATRTESYYMSTHFDITFDW